ncbi:MAG: hypothetical protein ACI9T7_000269 [Oleiphilaceae bacterium]|jgi:hypothetical protein
MKKLLLCAVIAASPLTAMAAGGHGPAGCGLGTEVIFKQANEWHEHVLAATTNGTSGNQTFGMTSGTLGCSDANGPLASGVDMFIDNNLEQIAAESSTGEGETISALSELIGVDAKDEAAFKAALKTNFDQIFTSINTTSNDVYGALVAIMSTDAKLSKYLG